MSRFRLSDYGYSRVFAAELIYRLRRLGVVAFTADFLLRHEDPDLVYALRRAANLEAVLGRHGRRRSAGGRPLGDVARAEVARFFDRFYRAEAPLPTRDGVEDAWVCPAPGEPRAWRLLRFRPDESLSRRALAPSERAGLAVAVPRDLSELSERELRGLAAAIRRDDLAAAGETLRVDPSRVRDVLPLVRSLSPLPVDPANDPAFDPDA